MQITVSRAPADNQGPNIIDPLLTSDRVGVARCTRDIDYNSTDRDIPSCRCPSHDYISTGSMAQVIESYGRWPGPVKFWSLTLTVSGNYYVADVGLEIEREI